MVDEGDTTVTDRFLEEVDKPYEEEEQARIVPASVRDMLREFELRAQDFDLRSGVTGLRAHFTDVVSPDAWKEVPGAGVFTTPVLGMEKPRNNVTIAYIGENDTPPIHVHIGDSSRTAKPAEVTGTFRGALVKLSSTGMRPITPAETPVDKFGSIDIYMPQFLVAEFARRNVCLLERLGVLPADIGKGWLGVYQQIGSSSTRLQLSQVERGLGLLRRVEDDLYSYGERGAAIVDENRAKLEAFLRTA